MTASPQSPHAGPLPAWVVLHVPHDATHIPAVVRTQFMLDDVALQQELLRMTDHHTLALFAGGDTAQVVRASVSRLVVDVERFVPDQCEPMAARGMGAIYAVTADLAPLRRPLTTAERQQLLAMYYHAHHARLRAAVDRALRQHDRCLVLDCHSFPGAALPYEQAAAGTARPDICIGTDAFHTPEPLATAFMQAFATGGWQVARDTPFGGALVPATHYRRDARVAAVMVEVNRRLYLDEASGARLPGFAHVATRIQHCCRQAVARILPAGD